MIGARLLYHPSGNAEWIFVEAPLEVTGGFLSVWEPEPEDDQQGQGIVYMSREGWKFANGQNIVEEICYKAATNREDYLFVPRACTHDRREALTVTDISKFAAFLERADSMARKGDFRMERAAYMICSLMVQWGGEKSPETSRLLQSVFKGHAELVA
jgi:hypothetical protein